MDIYILDEKVKLSDNAKYIKYIITNNNCWECVSHSKNNSGYISLFRKKSCMMHRYIYKIYKGEIPDGMVIMHSCDNRACINPEHLKLGTYSDNNYDMYKKNRQGERNTKLDKKQLLEIKQMIIKGKTLNEISKKFNVHWVTISKIKNGKKPYCDILNGGLKEWKV